MRFRLILPCLLALSMALPAQAIDNLGAALVVPEPVKPLVADMKLQYGKIDLGNGIATLNLPDDLAYLEPDDTEILLTKVWGIPVRDNLGSIVPAKIPLGAPASWAMAIAYRPTGWIDDTGASKLDPAELLTRRKEAMALSNKKLADVGLSKLGINIGDWEIAPYYVKDAHALIWAEQFRAWGWKNPLVNSYISILNRKGVLKLTNTARREQQPMIEASLKQIAKAIRFNPPHRYEDFNPASDKASAYTVSNLIAGTDIITEPHKRENPVKKPVPGTAGKGE